MISFNLRYSCKNCDYVYEGLNLIHLVRDKYKCELRCKCCNTPVNIYSLLYSSVPNTENIISVLSLYIYNYLAESDKNNVHSLENFKHYEKKIKSIIEFILSYKESLLYELINLKNTNDFDTKCWIYSNDRYYYYYGIPDIPIWCKYNHKPYQIIKTLSDAICFGMINRDDEEFLKDFAKTFKILNKF